MMPTPLRDLRIQHGLTQTELAALTGVTQAEISRIERGKRRLTVDLLLTIARALDVSPAELLIDDDQAA